MSKPVVDLTPPTDGDIDYLVEHMRDQDVVELLAGGHDDIRSVLADSIRLSLWSYAVRVNGELACIMGLGTYGTALTPTGVPWMLGTPLVKKQRRVLVRLGHQYIAKMLDAAPRLINTVHAENSVAIRWLERMGFDLHPPHQAGPRGDSFCVFEMKRTTHV